jgi:hypothetical protein
MQCINAKNASCKNKQYDLIKKQSVDCQPYSCGVVYPNIVPHEDCSPARNLGAVTGPRPSYSTDEYPIRETNCRPFGYQPKRYNPGGLKFHMYEYPFQTADGVPITHPGQGWYGYETTGVYQWE